MPRSITKDANYTVDEPQDAFDTPLDHVESDSGWEAFNKIKSTGFLDRFQPTSQKKLFKILDEQPVKAYRQHWIDNSPVPKKSFVCETKGNCPLCDKLGDKPAVRVLWNVVDMSGPAPEVKTWTIGSQLTETLSNMSQEKLTSPLNRSDVYFTVFQTGGGTAGRVSYTLNSVKERDLVDDYETQPLTSTQLENFKEVMVGPESVRHSTQEELNQVADHVLALRNNR